MTKFISSPAVAVAALLLLNGCTSDPRPTVGEYRLPLLNNLPEHVCHAAERQVMVSDLMLSQGILVQQSATRIHAARQHRWSGSLEQQLKQSAQRVLSADGCSGKVLIQVMDFYGDDQGHAVVSGHWRFQQGDRVIARTFSHRQPLATDGYDALVMALNQAWTDTLMEIKNAIPN